MRLDWLGLSSESCCQITRYLSRFAIEVFISEIKFSINIGALERSWQLFVSLLQRIKVSIEQEKIFERWSSLFWQSCWSEWSLVSDAITVAQLTRTAEIPRNYLIRPIAECSWSATMEWLTKHSAHRVSTGTPPPTSAIIHKTPDAWRTRVLNVPSSQGDQRHLVNPSSPLTQDRKSNIPTSWTARSTTLPGALSSSHTILTASSSTSASMVAPFCKLIHDCVIQFLTVDFPNRLRCPAGHSWDISKNHCDRVENVRCAVPRRPF